MGTSISRWHAAIFEIVYGKRLITAPTVPLLVGAEVPALVGLAAASCLGDLGKTHSQNIQQQHLHRMEADQRWSIRLMVK